MSFCNHMGHAGGHRPMPIGSGCWCGTPGCDVCPDVKDSPTATIVKFDAALSAEDVEKIRGLAEGGKIRTFQSGATRDTEDGKLDFEAYLSPAVLVRYAEYMQTHQTRSDGTQRAGDDWQQGMPKDVYAKSMLRHLMDFWLLQREHQGLATQDIQDALCGIIFNAMGYLFNELTSFDG